MTGDLAKRFDELADRDRSLFVTATTSPKYGNRTMHRCASNNGIGGAVRDFYRLASEAIALLGLPNPAPHHDGPVWIEYLFDHASDSYTTTSIDVRDGATGDMSPHKARAWRIDNAAGASASLLRRIRPAMDSHETTPADPDNTPARPETNDHVLNWTRPAYPSEVAELMGIDKRVLMKDAAIAREQIGGSNGRKYRFDFDAIAKRNPAAAEKLDPESAS